MYSINAGIFSTIIAQRLVKRGSRAIEGWVHFLALTITIELVCVVIFLIFASGEQQEWAKIPDETEVAKAEPPLPEVNRKKKET
ncbi:hypothetical protein Ciccas_012372 [Cichlidogyrus casuarinus]|uniref:Uncharacterized protein n=1 Tax=Cichlidogyrus casuarinus TaxID=1844966 RepID=A0ABD2PQW5_9PLAT